MRQKTNSLFLNKYGVCSILGHLIRAKDFVRLKKRKSISSMVITEKPSVCPKMKKNKPSAASFFSLYVIKPNHLNKSKINWFFRFGHSHYCSKKKKRRIFALDRYTKLNKKGFKRLWPETGFKLNLSIVRIFSLMVKYVISKMINVRKSTWKSLIPAWTHYVLQAAVSKLVQCYWFCSDVSVNQVFRNGSDWLNWSCD